MQKQKARESPAFFLSMADWECDMAAGALDQCQFQILRTGEFYDERYGTFEITPQMLMDLKTNFDRNILQVDLALDVNHMPEDGAVAWFKELSVINDGLWAKFKDFTPDGTDMFLTKKYRYFSVEMAPFVQMVGGKKQTIQNVLRGAALTNRPVIKGMQPTFFSETAKPIIKEVNKPKHMNAIMVFAESLLGRSKIGSEDVTSLKQMHATLSEDEQKASAEKVSEVEAKAAAQATAEAEAATKAAADAEAAKVAEAGKAGEGEKVLAEKTAAVTALKLAETKLAEYAVKELAEKHEKQAASFILAEGNLVGFTKEVAETAGLKGFVATLSDVQVAQFQTLVKGVTTVTSQMLSEMGHGKPAVAAGDMDAKKAEAKVLAEKNSKEKGIAYHIALADAFKTVGIVS